MIIMGSCRLSDGHFIYSRRFAVCDRNLFMIDVQGATAGITSIIILLFVQSWEWIDS